MLCELFCPFVYVSLFCCTVPSVPCIMEQNAKQMEYTELYSTLQNTEQNETHGMLLHFVSCIFCSVLILSITVQSIPFFALLFHLLNSSFTVQVLYYCWNEVIGYL